MLFLSLDTGKEIVSLFHYMHKVPLLSPLQSKMRCIEMNPAWFLYPGVDWDGEDRVKTALIGTVQEMRPRTGSIEPENNQIQVLIRSRAGLEWCEVGSFSNSSLINCQRNSPIARFSLLQEAVLGCFPTSCWSLLGFIERNGGRYAAKGWSPN